MKSWQFTFKTRLWCSPIFQLLKKWDFSEFSPLFLLPGGDQLDPAATRDLMTFSTGVRYCPGKDMAFANSFVVLGTMLLRYDFNMVKHPEDWIPQRGLTLKPKHYTITLSHVWPSIPGNNWEEKTKNLQYNLGEINTSVRSKIRHQTPQKGVVIPQTKESSVKWIFPFVRQRQSQIKEKIFSESHRHVKGIFIGKPLNKEAFFKIKYQFEYTNVYKYKYKYIQSSHSRTPRNIWSKRPSSLLPFI